MTLEDEALIKAVNEGLITARLNGELLSPEEHQRAIRKKINFLNPKSFSKTGIIYSVPD